VSIYNYNESLHLIHFHAHRFQIMTVLSCHHNINTKGLCMPMYSLQTCNGTSENVSRFPLLFYVTSLRGVHPMEGKKQNSLP